MNTGGKEASPRIDLIGNVVGIKDGSWCFDNDQLGRD